MNINDLKVILDRNKEDLVIFYNLDSAKTTPNMFYFSGYNGIGALVIPRKQRPFLIAPDMEVERAKKSGFKVYPMEKKRFFESILAVIIKNKIKRKRAAIDNNNFTLNSYKYFRKQFKGIKTKDISLDCLKLRQIKTNKEILILKKSCNYAGKILKKAICGFKDFKTEADVAAFLEYETKKLGLDIAFKPVVASGINGSMPHHEPKNVKLKKGFCVIDFGVKYKGYCSDITRTIYLGNISKREREIYKFLLGVQKNTVRNIKINDSCSRIYEECVKNLKNYSKFFNHGLGHGVGVEIHELPNLTLNSKDKILKNMVFTIEPGIYIPNKFGIRIEDTVLMENKPIILTGVTKDLLIV
ncbi:Xaa-Pro peptidase family protein [Candidatus Woesearchaeota archaeon]|nr:Xaa-Pro peptidase family protein [Candidatus Woesearchaeota archaeon]